MGALTRLGTRRWWWLPLLYVIFIAYQSLVGENLWNCGRWLSNPVLAGWRYLSLGDFLANVLAYMPLGFLLAGPWVPHRTGRGLLWAVLGGFALSLLMESLQRCLPGRIPSSWDLLANSLGAFMGGLLAWFWQGALEAHVPTRMPPAERALALKSSALRTMLILAVLAWLAYQSAPWVFTFDPGQIRQNFSWLTRPASLSWSVHGFVRHFGAWMAMLLAWRLSASTGAQGFSQERPVGPWVRWALASLGAVLAAQLALESRALGPEELLAMALALILSLLLARALRDRHDLPSLLSAWVALFALAALLAYQFEPAPSAAQAVAADRVSLWPRVGLNQTIHAIDFALFFGWFGVMLAVAACARPSADLRFARLARADDLALPETDEADHAAPAPWFALGWKLPLAAALMVALTEMAQLGIPGRSVDPSPVIFTLLGYLFASRMVSRPTPIY